jgi:hypothetical protein
MCLISEMFVVPFNKKNDTISSNKYMLKSKYVALFIHSSNIVFNPEYIGVKPETIYTCVSAGDLDENPLITSHLAQCDDYIKYSILNFSVFLWMLQASKSYIQNLGDGLSVLDQQELLNELSARLIADFYDANSR